MLIRDYRYTGPVVGINRVFVPEGKINRRVPLTDQLGNTSMLLTVEQDKFLKALGIYNYLLNNRYISFTRAGQTRMYPYAFEGDTVVLTYMRGSYGRLLSIGTNPKYSEAYRLNILTCNSKTLPHCFMDVIPLFQPPLLVTGDQNYWSIRLEYIR